MGTELVWIFRIYGCLAPKIYLKNKENIYIHFQLLKRPLQRPTANLQAILFYVMIIIIRPVTGSGNVRTRQCDNLSFFRENRPGSNNETDLFSASQQSRWFIFFSRIFQFKFLIERPYRAQYYQFVEWRELRIQYQYTSRRKPFLFEKTKTRNLLFCSLSSRKR